MIEKKIDKYLNESEDPMRQKLLMAIEKYIRRNKTAAVADILLTVYSVIDTLNIQPMSLRTKLKKLIDTEDKAMDSAFEPEILSPKGYTTVYIENHKARGINSSWKKVTVSSIGDLVKRFFGKVDSVEFAGEGLTDGGYYFICPYASEMTGEDILAFGGTSEDEADKEMERRAMAI